MLQERETWERFTGKKAVYGGCDAELFFEENDMDGFLARLQKQEPPVSYVNESMEHDWGQRVVRLYDPDRHVIEVGESMNFVARRFLNIGDDRRHTAEKTQLPLAQIREMAGGNELLAGRRSRIGEKGEGTCGMKL